MPLFPGQAPRSLALMFFVAGLLFLLGGLVQINPIWQWGPFEPWLGTNGAQPDWYLGWLIGALRLMPELRRDRLGTSPSFPTRSGAACCSRWWCSAWRSPFPWVERRLTGDRSVHNLADRPRDAPSRTAFGVAFLSLDVPHLRLRRRRPDLRGRRPELQRAAVRVPGRRSGWCRRSCTWPPGAGVGRCRSPRRWKRSRSARRRRSGCVGLGESAVRQQRVDEGLSEPCKGRACPSPVSHRASSRLRPNAQ